MGSGAEHVRDEFDEVRFHAEAAERRRRNESMTDAEFAALLADGTRAAEARDCEHPDWWSPSWEAWFFGHGVRMLPKGRVGHSVSWMLHEIGFLLDNPYPKDTIRLSFELVTLIAGRSAKTTRKYVSLLNDANIVLAEPDDTYRRGLWLPYPANVPPGLHRPTPRAKPQ